MLKRCTGVPRTFGKGFHGRGRTVLCRNSPCSYPYMKNCFDRFSRRRSCVRELLRAVLTFMGRTTGANGRKRRKMACLSVSQSRRHRYLRFPCNSESISSQSILMMLLAPVSCRTVSNGSSCPTCFLPYLVRRHPIEWNLRSSTERGRLYDPAKSTLLWLLSCFPGPGLPCFNSVFSCPSKMTR